MNLLTEIERRKPIYKAAEKIRHEAGLLTIDYNPDYMKLAIKSLKEEYGYKIDHEFDNWSYASIYTIYDKDTPNIDIEYFKFLSKFENVLSKEETRDYKRLQKTLTPIGCLEDIWGNIGSNIEPFPILTDLPETTKQLNWLITHDYSQYLEDLFDSVEFDINQNDYPKFTIQELLNFMKEKGVTDTDDYSN